MSIALHQTPSTSFGGSMMTIAYFLNMQPELRLAWPYPSAILPFTPDLTAWLPVRGYFSLSHLYLITPILSSFSLIVKG